MKAKASGTFAYPYQSIRDLPYIQIGPVKGMPVYWGNDQTGKMRAAVGAYYDTILNKGAINSDQLKLLTDYLEYFIHAPCWENNLKESEDMMADLYQLRERSKTLASVESIRRWIEESMELGLDPL